MIAFLLRPVARLAALLVLGVIGIAGLVLAVAAAVPGGLPWLADTLGTPGIRDDAVRAVARLEHDGPTATNTLWTGVAMLGGGLLVALGGLWPQRERLLDLGEGRSARRRAVADAAAALARRAAPGRVKARVRGRRGRLVVSVPALRKAAVAESVKPLASEIGRRLVVRTDRRTERVR